ncbi:MAG: class I SAM-dependent methyltransferase [Candidatus Omnitrophica bacterium]|nr:class I SAM-dependent methyltransferase [Candidatus Omnitrophota bacterium]
MKCKICSANTDLVIDFGPMPIANGFIKSNDQDEYTFPMTVNFCPVCKMVQLGETVPPEKMFNDDYQFLSSTSTAMAKHFEMIARHLICELKNKEDPFVVELGCNDGIMLKHVAQSSIRHLGVEPSGNVARMARENGVEVTSEFFHARTAKKIIDQYGNADVIGGSNVFCHIEDINSVFEGIALLLKEDGTLYFEDPYIYDIIQKTSFDQIYDEHVYYYSGHSVQALGRRHGLELVDMLHQDVHGGSMRYILKKSGAQQPSERVKDWLQKERVLKLDQLEGYLDFKDRVDRISKTLNQKLSELKQMGERVVGYGATSKSTTLLNYAKVDASLVEYISDTTPNKINKLTPRTHIPIKPYEEFSRDHVNYTLLLAWNHEKEIRAKEEQYINRGGKFITFFPEVEIK